MEWINCNRVTWEQTVTVGGAIIHKLCNFHLKGPSFQQNFHKNSVHFQSLLISLQFPAIYLYSIFLSPFLLYTPGRTTTAAQFVINVILYMSQSNPWLSWWLFPTLDTTFYTILSEKNSKYMYNSSRIWSYSLVCIFVSSLKK